MSVPENHRARGAAETDGGPASWPVASGATTTRDRPGPPRGRRPARHAAGSPDSFALLQFGSFVTTTKCGSGTVSPRTWNPLEEGSLREADARVGRRRGRRTRDGRPPDRNRLVSERNES